jgi:transcriptional regulator
MFVPERYQLDPKAARELVALYGMAAIINSGEEGLRATYGYCLLDRPGDCAEGDLDSFTVVGHIARGDPQATDLEAGAPTLLLFEGPHGYVSASWYSPDLTTVPSTWAYSAVHLYGAPEVLLGDEGFEVVRRTLEHHESAIEDGSRFHLDTERLEFAHELYPGVVPFRLRPTRIEAKMKLNQDYPPAVVDRVIDCLEAPGPYQNRALAADMRRLAQHPTDPRE